MDIVIKETVIYTRIRNCSCISSQDQMLEIIKQHPYDDFLDMPSFYPGTTELVGGVVTYRRIEDKNGNVIFEEQR